MQLFPPTAVLRHQRENLKKCSLKGLETRPDFKFYSYPKEVDKLNVDGYILLTLEAPPLMQEDNNKGLFLIDATWRYAEKMLNALPNSNVIYRSIPSCFRTAYPRRQEDCSQPDRGLASIEALFIAYMVLKRDPISLMDNYYWKQQFFEINHKYIEF